MSGLPEKTTAENLLQQLGIAPHQINAILGIPGLTDNDNALLYEIIGSLYTVKSRDAYIEYITNTTEDNVVFNEYTFSKEKKKYFEETEHLRRNNAILNGIPCRHCKSTQTKATFQTLRSGDEGQILVNECFSCGITTGS